MYESTLRDQADLEWLARYEHESHQLFAQPSDGDAEEEEAVEEMCVEADVSKSQTYSDRLTESRQFCTRFFSMPPERQSPQCLYERLAHERRDFVGHPLSAASSQCNAKRCREASSPPVELNHKKGMFYVKSDDVECTTEIEFQFANFVTVTYLGNALTGDDYAFNSHALINGLLPYYPEFRKKKFAKVNLRLRDCGSQMIYNSGIIVESGSDCMRKSREMLRHLIGLLRHDCGCRHLVLQRRTCFNIVATGNVRELSPDGRMRDASLCLGVLKDLFPAASYKKDKFQGIIIKLLDVEKHFADQAYHAGLSNTGPKYWYAVAEDNARADAEMIAQINSECEEGADGYAARLSDEAVAQRNATLDDDYAQLATKNENGTFLIFEGGQIISTGCKSQQRVLEAYDQIYSLLLQCLPTPENLAREKALSLK